MQVVRLFFAKNVAFYTWKSVILKVDHHSNIWGLLLNFTDILNEQKDGKRSPQKLHPLSILFYQLNTEVE